MSHLVIMRLTWISTLLVVLSMTFQYGSAVMCYDCNSEFDPRCGDPFDPYTIGQVNCSFQQRLEHLGSELQPVLCRKIWQKTHGKERIVRTCGYIKDENYDDKKLCAMRSGTHDVRAQYCSCTTDLCNSAESSVSSIGLVGLVTIITIYFRKTLLL